MHPRATENAVAGHMWPAGRKLSTPAVDSGSLITKRSPDPAIHDPGLRFQPFCVCDILLE